MNENSICTQKNAEWMNKIKTVSSELMEDHEVNLHMDSLRATAKKIL